MSQQFYIVVNQVLVFAILMLIGFVMAKAGVLGSDVLNGLSRLIIKLLLPCLIFHLIIGNGITISYILANRNFALALLLMYTLLCLLGYAMGGASGLRRSGQDVFAVATMFCNIGFMGLPLIDMTLDQILLWSVGVFLCTRNAKRKGGSMLRNLLNPSLVGIAIALVLLYFGITLPDPVVTTIKGLGDCSRYLALLYLGALLATMPVLSMLMKPHVYVLIVLKMTIVPVIAYFVTGLFFDHTVSLLLATILSLPPMVAITMMARTYGGDERVAAETVFVSTIACLGTSPLVQFLIDLLSRIL